MFYYTTVSRFLLHPKIKCPKAPSSCTSAATMRETTVGTSQRGYEVPPTQTTPATWCSYRETGIWWTAPGMMSTGVIATTISYVNPIWIRIMHWQNGSTDGNIAKEKYDKDRKLPKNAVCQRRHTAFFGKKHTDM